MSVRLFVGVNPVIKKSFTIFYSFLHNTILLVVMEGGSVQRSNV